MSVLKSAILHGYRPRKDRSVSLTFVTDEVDAEEIKTIHEHLDKYGIVYFKEGNVLTEEEQREIDNFKMHSHKGKTHSQRLRGVLFVLHSQSHSNLSFEEFYAKEMERIIQHYKDKLD